MSDFIDIEDAALCAGLLSAKLMSGFISSNWNQKYWSDEARKDCKVFFLEFLVSENHAPYSLAARKGALEEVVTLAIAHLERHRRFLFDNIKDEKVREDNINVAAQKALPRYVVEAAAKTLTETEDSILFVKKQTSTSKKPTPSKLGSKFAQVR